MLKLHTTVALIVALTAAAMVPRSAAAADVGASLAEPVVAQGGVTITIGDVDAYMARIPADKWAGFVSSGTRIESMLKDLLRVKQLAQQARDMKLDADPEVQSKLALAQDTLLANIRAEAFAKSIRVPDLTQLAKEEYLTHKDQYVIPADFVVQQILIMAHQRSDDEAQKLADTVRAQAVTDPAHFEDLVEKYSEDPTKAKNKGVMKDATSKKYAPQFAKAAGELTEANPVSPVVKTKFGYHILKLMSSTPARQQTFAEAKDTILEGLNKQYVMDQNKDFLNQLSNQKMTPYPDAIASLHDRYYTGTGVPLAAPAKPSAPTAAPTKP